jgi:hypothetical protein
MLPTNVSRAANDLLLVHHVDHVPLVDNGCLVEPADRRNGSVGVKLRLLWQTRMLKKPLNPAPILSSNNAKEQVTI